MIAAIRAFLLAAFAASTLAACNTIQGIGEDISAGSRTVERAVD